MRGGKFNTYNISHILDPYAQQNSLHTMRPLGKKNMAGIFEMRVTLPERGTNQNECNLVHFVEGKTEKTSTNFV